MTTTDAPVGARRVPGAGSEEHPDGSGRLDDLTAQLHGASQTSTGAARTPAEPSLADLVQTASRDLSLLVSKEVELAKAEARVAVKGAITGAAGFGVAAVFGLAAAIMAMFTIAEALNELLPRPLAFLITAVLFLLLAGIAALVGLRGAKGIQKPERTLSTVKDDIAWAKHPTVAPTITSPPRG